MDEAPPESWGGSTGHHVGNGWAHLRHVLGCGDGVLIGVSPDGLVHYYRYDGDGSRPSDWAEGSGNPIASGWDAFSSMFVMPRQGEDATPGRLRQRRLRRARR